MVAFLPQRQVQGRNLLLDLAPLNDGLQSYRQGMDRQYQTKLNEEQRTIENAQAADATQFRNKSFDAQQQNQQAQLGIQQQRLAMDKDSHAQNTEIRGDQLKSQRIKSMAGIAQLIDQEQDPAKRQQMWEAYKQRDPKVANALPEQYRDPVNGPKFLIAEARGYVDPVDRETRDVELDLKRAQAEKARRPSLADRLLDGGSVQPQPQPVQPQGGFIQQSNPVQPGVDPNLQLTAGGAQPQAAQAQPDMITLPNGRQIPRKDAEQLKFGLAMEGNKAGADALDALINPTGERIGEAASNSIDKSLFDSGNMLQRLSGVKDTFKRDYMGWGNRLGNLGLDIAARIDPTSLSEEQRRGVQEYAKFRRAAAENVNRYIKEITGAQMSEAEAQRLMLAAPNAGQGIFDGDGPDTFIGKIQDIERTTKLSMARMYYLKKNGFKPTRDENGYLANLPIGLDDTSEMIQQRTRQLQQRARAEGVPDAQLRPWVQQNLKQEFGI